MPNRKIIQPAGEYVIPFGIHKGKRLREAPFLYAVWVATNEGIRARDRSFYFAAIRVARKQLDCLIADMAPSPPRRAGEPFRVLSAAEFSGVQHDDLC